MADSRPTSDQKPRVFISYSRTDMAFADRLVAELKVRDVDPLIDRTEIYAFEDWWKRIQALISWADTVIFILSPAAVASDVCQKEVAFAASLNKRFAPVVIRPVDIEAVPKELSQLNFIFFENETEFEACIARLGEALTTNIDWVRRHSEFGTSARAWDLGKRPAGLLLRSPLLEAAEQWVGSRPRGAPEPTTETREFVVQSRRAAVRRRNIFTGSLAAGLIFAIGLAGLAYWQRGIAREQRDQVLLTQSRYVTDLATQATGKNHDHGTGLLLALEALPDKSTKDTFNDNRYVSGVRGMTV